jgi:hypothetical protein
MRYTVLTYIFDGYEKVHEIREKDPDADYVLVTDDKNLKSDTWRVVHDDSLNRFSAFGRCYEVRFHPFSYVDTPIVVRVDGSIELRKSLKPMVDAFELGRYDRCLMIHPLRNRFDVELDVWVKCRKYPREVADRCLKMMRGFGYDLGYQGMFQGCFEVVRKTSVNLDANRLTYHLMKYTGGEIIDRLDQHIFSFVINTQFSDTMKILPVSEDIVTDGKWMQWYGHHSKSPIAQKKKAQAMMFNKPVVCWR